MVSKAIARFTRISPRKARVIVNLVRGRQAGEALQLLEFTQKAAAPVLKKLIESAVANATHAEPGRRRRRALRRDGLRRQGPEQAHAPLAPPRDGSRDPGSEGPQPHHRHPRRALGKRASSHGSESPPVRLPPRRHQDVELEVVRGQELREVAPRGHPHQARGQGVPHEREHRGRRDRARRQQVQGHRLHGAARHGHRQGRQGHRDAEDRQPRRRPPRARPLFPGVQSFTENEVFIDVQEVRKAETAAQLVAENIATQLERRVAFRRAMKKAAHDGDEVRRQGHPHPLLGPPRRQRDEPRRDLPRGARSAPHAARRHRVRPRRGPHQVRDHRRQGVDLQGRGAPAPQPPPARIAGA